MNAMELADKLQLQVEYMPYNWERVDSLLWDGGAMLRNLHTENMALRATEYALRDRIKELERQLAARVPDGMVVIPARTAWGIVGSTGHARKRHVEDLQSMLAAAPQPVVQGAPAEK